MDKLVPLSFLLLFPVFWCLVTLLISWLGGWHGLAACYASRAVLHGPSRHFESAYLGSLGRYRSCLTVGVDEAGLHLAVFFLFRPGHPPLFIPWADVLAPAERRMWLFSGMEYRFRRTPGITLWVDKTLGEWIASAAARGWGACGKPQVPGS